MAAASSGATVPDTEPAGTTGGSAAPAGEPVTFETGLEFNSILLPKFTGIAVFDQANQGAQEAAAELGAQPAEFLGPTADNSVAGQIDIVTDAATQGVDAVMMSNNAGDQIVPAVQSLVDTGAVVVTWDSHIPTAEGESVFVAQVDFDETGTVMADMARSILGDDGGQFAILSASPDSGQPERVDRRAQRGPRRSGVREPRARRHGLRQRQVEDRTTKPWRSSTSTPTSS